MNIKGGPSMKRIHKVLIALLAVAAIGLNVALIAANNNRIVKEASASRSRSVTGLYHKITDISKLTVGKTVILVSPYQDVLQDCGGNPAYLYTTRDNVSFTDDQEYAFANTAFITELTVCQGSAANSFAFKGTYFLGWHYDDTHYDGYIAFDDRGSSPSIGGKNDYYDDDVGVGFFKDGTGLRKSIVAESSFTAWYGKVNPNDDWEEPRMHLSNVAGHGDLGFTSYYARRFVLNVSGGVDLYEKVTLNHAIVETGPTKTNYKVGEKVDLTGLVVSATFSDGSNPFISYTDNETFFQHNDVITNNGEGRLYFWFASVKELYVNVAISEAGQDYIKLTESLNDYRGNYVFAAYYDTYGEPAQDYYYALGFQQKESGTGDINYNMKSVTVSVNSDNALYDIGTPYDSVFFELVKVNGKYHVRKTYTEHVATKYLGNSYGNVELFDSATDGNAMEVEYDANNHCAYLKLYNTSTYLILMGESFAFADTTENRVQLYKQELSGDEYESINTFVSNFHDATKVCIPDGKALNITTETWAAQASAFNALTPGAQGYIAGTTYTHNQETYGSLNDIVDRYDYIISKYNQFDDFMSRSNNASYQNNYNPSSTAIMNGNINHSTHIVIVAVSVTGIAIILVAVLMKKRKHQ